ncbi:hypothetical protein CJ030_MR8G019197 [Morella rubra]|uniref:Uncharacterized protein n=1 Tax=Morella rubra TaxID=262757 RepID=A0A6A1UN98_9ROSI|nr:hypothetical protein CJ030_MR8G019197 [Morella rubra]
MGTSSDSKSNRTESKEKLTKIAASLGGAAIGEARGEVLEVGLARDDVLAEGFELRDGALLGSIHDDSTFRILPRGLPSRPLMLDQYVRCPNLIGRRGRRHSRLLLVLILVRRPICRRDRGFLSLAIGLYLCRTERGGGRGRGTGTGSLSSLKCSGLGW